MSVAGREWKNSNSQRKLRINYAHAHTHTHIHRQAGKQADTCTGADNNIGIGTQVIDWFLVCHGVFLPLCHLIKFFPTFLLAEACAKEERDLFGRLSGVTSPIEEPRQTWALTRGAAPHRCHPIRGVRREKKSQVDLSRTPHRTLLEKHRKSKLDDYLQLKFYGEK